MDRLFRYTITVYILYSDNAGGIDITAKLSLYPTMGKNTKVQKYQCIQYITISTITISNIYCIRNAKTIQS